RSPLPFGDRRRSAKRERDSAKPQQRTAATVCLFLRLRFTGLLFLCSRSLFLLRNGFAGGFRCFLLLCRFGFLRCFGLRLGLGFRFLLRLRSGFWLRRPWCFFENGLGFRRLAYQRLGGVFLPSVDVVG